ncbi:fimbrial major subunit CsuA/B family protein [Pseudoduganella sp. FT25W]|jgi:spore coat protein U-like protein|uniref:Fimbrial major subunit CsuA/B family protein n=1 Tax=Duganella alba TaxID=2666081 RepID=A0A6L5QEJ5_9BURK|nr:spore coat protein U domain-containing protein [Duganella alba]MRX08164.1 fimbrial major subunit CsuA/B family protein [Duganella alba]MRX16299.1 fimbrial major subunit CsuA/B family protein [Duganella alba]
MISLRHCLALLGLLLALASGQARADSCSVAQSDIVFPTVSSISSTDVYASANFKVTCTWTSFLAGLLFPNATVCLYLGNGSGNGASMVTVPRQIANGAKTVNYNIYTDASYSAAKVWGGWAGTTTAANLITFTFNKTGGVGSLSQDVNLYAKLNADAALSSMNVGPDNLTFTSDFSGGNVLFRYMFFLTGLGDCTLGTSVAMPFQVRATVINDCNINVGNLAFPNSSLLTSAVRTTANLAVQCSNNTAYRIAFSGGSNGTVSARKMLNAASMEVINYQLSSSLDGPSLGDGTASTVIVSGTGDGTTRSQTLFGLVPSQTTPSPGDYKDTITATVQF